MVQSRVIGWVLFIVIMPKRKLMWCRLRQLYWLCSSTSVQDAYTFFTMTCELLHFCICSLQLFLHFLFEPFTKITPVFYLFASSSSSIADIVVAYLFPVPSNDVDRNIFQSIASSREEDKVSTGFLPLPLALSSPCSSHSEPFVSGTTISLQF